MEKNYNPIWSDSKIEASSPRLLSAACDSIIKYDSTSLSTIVLNSRDWSEILWLPRNSRFKINLPKGLYPKKPAGIHWLGRNDAVP